MGADSKEQQGATPSPDAAKTATTPAKAEKEESFEAKVDKLTAKYEEKTKELKKKFFTPHSIGKGTVDVIITGRQQNRLKAAADKKKEEFNQLAAEKKKERMSVLLGETEQELINIHEPYEKIIEYLRGVDKLDNIELVKFEAILEAVSRMKTSPEMDKLFLKALNKEAFKPEDFELLVSKIIPKVISYATDQKDTRPIFETSNVGAIIGVMQDSEKMKLMEVLVAKKNPTDYMQIIESFVVAGVISNLQLQYLIEKVIPQPHAEDLKKRLEQGEINKKQKEYQDKIMRLANVNTGRTADNPLNKMASGAGLMALAGVWGIASALLAAKVNWDWSKPGKSLGDTVTSPHFLIGTAAAFGGVVATTAVASPETYEKWKDKLVGFFSGPKEQQERITIKKNQISELLENSMKSNPFIISFLQEKEEVQGGMKKTGLEIIKEYVTETKTAGKPINFDIKDLKARCGRKQQELLDKAYSSEGGKDINFGESMNTIMAGLTASKQDNNEDLAKMVEEIKRKQGVK